MTDTKAMFSSLAHNMIQLHFSLRSDENSCLKRRSRVTDELLTTIITHRHRAALCLELLMSPSPQTTAIRENEADLMFNTPLTLVRGEEQMGCEETSSRSTVNIWRGQKRKERRQRGNRRKREHRNSTQHYYTVRL